MAYEIPVQSISFVAGQDLRNYQYCAVKIDSSTGKLVLASAGDNALGILQDKPNLGEACGVMVYGVSKVKVVGGITGGSNVEVGVDGALTNATSGAVVGIALESVGDGGIGSILLTTRTSTGVNVNRSVMQLPVGDIGDNTATPLIDYIPGFSGTITKVAFVVTTAIDIETLGEVKINLKKNSSIISTITLDTDIATVGTVVYGSAVVNNTFTDTDKLSIDFAGSTGTNTGAGYLLVSLG